MFALAGLSECVLKFGYLEACAVNFWKVFVRYCQMNVYFKFIGHIFIIKLSKSFKEFFFNISLVLDFAVINS